MSRLPLTLGVAGAVVVVDQATKAWAVAALEGEPPVAVLGELLQLHFVRNPGAAFSLAGSYTVLISALAIGVSFAIVRTARTLSSTGWAVVLGGVLGGAVGNLVDRLLRSPAPFRGHVVDFLELPRWPIFNVADMALIGSAALVIVLTLRGVEMTVPAAGPTDGSEQQGDDPGSSPPAGDPDSAR